MTENDYRLISLRYSCPLLKQEDIQQGKVPTAPTIASIIGGLQVQEALKLIHELPVDDGQAMVFNGAANNFYKTNFVRRPDCLSHETYESIIELPLSAKSTTVAELLAATQAYVADEFPEFIFDESKFQLQLDRDFLQTLSCRTCEIEKEIALPRCQVSASTGVCQKCEQPMMAETIFQIGGDSELKSRTLSELGVPEFDVVKVTDGAFEFYVQLSEDRGVM